MTSLEIGNYIREKREEKKITQKSICKELNISARTAFRIENGANVSIENLLAYADKIGLKIIVEQ
jgi:transcriptional regulator with XRE-family HTH domain